MQGRWTFATLSIALFTLWFSPAAFPTPQPWQWGNAERNGVYGPGSRNWDIGLQKYFAISEKYCVQFQADFLNAFNHFNLGAADTRDGELPNANSGKIFGGRGNHVVHPGLEYIF